MFTMEFTHRVLLKSHTDPHNNAAFSISHTQLIFSFNQNHTTPISLSLPHNPYLVLHIKVYIDDLTLNISAQNR